MQIWGTNTVKGYKSLIQKSSIVFTRLDILNTGGRVSPILNHCYHHLGTFKYYSV